MVPNFLALRNVQQDESAISHSEQQTSLQPTSSAMVNPTIQVKRSSDRNRRSPSYYEFDNSSSDSIIAAPLKPSHRAGDVEDFQPPPASVVKTVQNIADLQPDEVNISPIIGAASPPAPHAPSLLEQDTPTLFRSMTVLEAENQETLDE